MADRILAFDLGAESGRALLGDVSESGVAVEELHRFPNEPVRTPDGLHWDALRLFREMKLALAACAERRIVPASIGVDSWGVDCALLDENNCLVSNPYHYRDSRVNGVMEEAFRRVPRDEIFRRTGIQFISFNTLYQLLATAIRQPHLFDCTAKIVSMSDLFAAWFSGRAVYEFSQATTTQFLDPWTKSWASDLLEKLGIPTHVLPEIAAPGTVLGGLLPYVQQETGLPEIPVVAPVSHDTGSAVAAVPAKGDGWAYISSGTWSLVGIEAKEPVITDASLAANFTNEGGAEGTYRILKNVDGLWLLQECRRAWAKKGRDLSYDEIASLASDAEPLRSVVDVDDAIFMSPADMPDAIATTCRASSQPAPDSYGAFARCVLESLALRHRAVIETLEGIVGKRIDTIHIVGGGSRNRLLCQFTADASGRRVVAGPAEATAIGNILVQAMALGRVSSLAEGRELVRRSSELVEYEPQPSGAWDEAYGRLLSMSQAAAS